MADEKEKTLQEKIDARRRELAEQLGIPVTLISPIIIEGPAPVQKGRR